MQLNWNKHWFIIVNIISCCISMIDVYVWRGADVGFPIFGILGACVSGIIVAIYKLILILSSGKNLKNIILELILLWFTFPFYGFLGVIGGLFVGSFIF